MLERFQDLPVAWALPLTFVAFTALIALVWALPRASILRTRPTVPVGAISDLGDGSRLLQLGIYLLTD